jgi:undecaprenyl diphosphate synthase
MDLAFIMVTRELKGIQKRGVRIMWLGSEDKVSAKLKQAIRNAEEATKNNTNGVLALCFNYGGQRELAEGMRRMVADGIEAESVNEATIAKYLYYPEIPPVDLVIRTSGEQRLSNFMLWRAAYSELYFVNKHWPDFTAADLDEALKIYAQRRRRFGG